MRSLIFFAAALALGQVAMAHELDTDDLDLVSQDQIDQAKGLPGTLVLEFNEDDPSNVQVFHLADKIAPGTKLTDDQLQQMATKSEERVAEEGDPKTELDRESSTSSWGFRFNSRVGVRRGYVGRGYVGRRYIGRGYYGRGYIGRGYIGRGYYGRRYYAARGYYGPYRGYYRGYYRPRYNGYYRPHYGGYYGTYGVNAYGGWNNWQNSQDYFAAYQQHYPNFNYYPANYSYLGSSCYNPCAIAAPTYAYHGYNYGYAPYYGYTTPAVYGVPVRRYVYYNYNPCGC